MQEDRADSVRRRSLAARDYYDSLAREFDELDRYWENPYDIATWNLENELVASFLDGREPILDVGAGFYPHVESTTNRRVINVDISSRSLEVARRIYHERNERMLYVCADALSMPFADGSFAGVVAGGELANHLAAGELLDEIVRLLQPGGIAMLSVGMKWCLDSLYAIADALLGNPIGYSMTRSEALSALSHPLRSSEVTWEVTPSSDLKVTLYSGRDLRRIIRSRPLRIKAVRALNVVSGVIPLPLQQDTEAPGMIRRLAEALLKADHSLFGRIPAGRWLGGNVYLVLERQ